jgi:hypothetical protein
MEGYERHLFQQNPKLVLKALSELPRPTFRDVIEPPDDGAIDYTLMSQVAAKVRKVDEVRTTAEAWEEAHAPEGET